MPDFGRRELTILVRKKSKIVFLFNYWISTFTIMQTRDTYINLIFIGSLNVLLLT
jgi:hypothetical protein